MIYREGIGDISYNINIIIIISSSMHGEWYTRLSSSVCVVDCYAIFLLYKME